MYTNVKIVTDDEFDDNLDIIFNFDGKLSTLIKNNLIDNFDHDYYNTLTSVTKDFIDQISIKCVLIINDHFPTSFDLSILKYDNNIIKITNYYQEQDCINKKDILDIKVRYYLVDLIDYINIINIIGMDVLQNLFIKNSKIYNELSNEYRKMISIQNNKFTSFFKVIILKDFGFERKPKSIMKYEVKNKI